MNMDFFNYKNDVAPGKGKLLVSEPFLPDPNFGRTVVLLCDHNPEGSFGFVVNKQANLSVDQIIQEISAENFPLFIGGPVEQNTLHYVHTNAEISGSIVIHDGLYWGGDFEETVNLVNSGNMNANEIKFFAGYSGWEESQLEEELKDNSWIVSELSQMQWIFEDKNEEVWKAVLKSLGGRFDLYANYPQDPRLN